MLLLYLVGGGRKFTDDEDDYDDDHHQCDICLILMSTQPPITRSGMENELYYR